eukprot:scaffold13569_cov87-Isochrysis_galbana.AAC.4
MAAATAAATTAAGVPGRGEARRVPPPAVSSPRAPPSLPSSSLPSSPHRAAGVQTDEPARRALPQPRLAPRLEGPVARVLFSALLPSEPPAAPQADWGPPPQPSTRGEEGRLQRERRSTSAVPIISASPDSTPASSIS